MDELRFVGFVPDLRTCRLTRAARDMGIVPFDEIKKAAWPGTVVDGKNLNVKVANPCPGVDGDL